MAVRCRRFADTPPPRDDSTGNLPDAFEQVDISACASTATVPRYPCAGTAAAGNPGKVPALRLRTHWRDLHTATIFARANSLTSSISASNLFPHANGTQHHYAFPGVAAFIRRLDFPASGATPVPYRPPPSPPNAMS